MVTKINWSIIKLNCNEIYLPAFSTTRSYAGNFEFVSAKRKKNKIFKKILLSLEYSVKRLKRCQWAK